MSSTTDRLVRLQALAPWAAGVMLLLLTVSLVVPLPWHSRSAGSLLDLVHAPAFAAISAAIFIGCRRWLPRSSLLAALLLWAALTAFGGATEIAQKFVHRGCSLQDAIDDSLGIAAGLCCAVGLVACRHGDDLPRDNR